MKRSCPIVGLDLDNTVIDYELSARKFALLNDIHGIDDISQLREFYKRHHQDKAWSLVQEWIYTEGLLFATVNNGLKELLYQLKTFDYPTYIISHKTKVSVNGLDLWGPARHWIAENLGKYFEPLSEIVFFEETREKKIARISHQKITHFVDDLQDVLLEPNFPSDVRKFWIKEGSGVIRHPSITKLERLEELLNYV
jgi:hypothetical protein